MKRYVVICYGCEEAADYPTKEIAEDIKQRHINAYHPGHPITKKEKVQIHEVISLEEHVKENR